ncbi:MAG: hypothetical protein Q8M15_05305 [Bacteroidota bacterium]|nr:hypothetical protein [Bacteroidota bacterium]
MTLIHLKTETYEQAQILEQVLSNINFVHEVKLDKDEMDDFTVSKLEESAALYKSNPESFKKWDDVKKDLLKKL